MRRVPALAAAVLGLAACSAARLPIAPGAQIAQADPSGITVYLIYNHFHSGLTVPSAAIVARPGPTARALARLAPRPWTSLGYGDAKFYQQQGINPARVLDFFRSMFALNNPSVVNLGGVQDPLRDRSHPRIVRLSISARRFDDLVREVDATFARGPGGAPQFLARGGTDDDAFWRASRPASAIHECNQWVGEVLGAAGVPHTAWLDTTADGLALDLVTSGHGVRVSRR